MVLQVERQVRDGHPVDPRRALVAPDSSQRLPQVVACDNRLHRDTHCHRAVGFGYRRAGFGPCRRVAPGFTPRPWREGQLQLGFLPHIPHEIAVLSLFPRSGLHRGRPRLLCPLLTSTPRSPASLHAQSGRPDTTWTSRGKSNRLHRGPAGSTAPALDGRGLRCEEPARPAGSASYPVLVHRTATLLHASFRPRLAGPRRRPCASLTLLHHQDG